MRPHSLEITQAQGQSAHNLHLSPVFRMLRQGGLDPRQFRIQFGHHMGQGSVVHSNLHHAADHGGLEQKRNKR